MTNLTVVKTRIHAGIWEGVVNDSQNSDSAPEIEVLHLERPVQSLALTQDIKTKGAWHLRIAIPPDLLSDGVQVFVIQDRETGEKLDAFTIITGEPLEDDIRSEIQLLREELDMLKRAFRRHCLETC